MSDLSAYGSSIQALKEQAQSCRDLKDKEYRLRDINKVASELESEGLIAEEAPMVQAQQQEHLGSAPGKVRVVLRLHQNQTWCLCYHSFVCLFVYRMKPTLTRRHPGRPYGWAFRRRLTLIPSR
ncbi:uncharacterized protein [Nothobranchius furzeri]|uniref:uncharacterized protein isoform X1 n=1 Tax=Nothobranchius furzeri TaxID=105023 RepID=UPI003904B350